MNLLVVVNSADAPPGLVERRIARRGWTMTRAFAQEAALPAATDGFAGLVVLGGPQDAWDDEAHPELGRVIALLRRFLAASKPILGICLGGQLLARALGGSVGRMKGGYERGLVPMTVPAGAPASIVPAAGARLASWHQDSFTLPEGAELLLSSESCPNQAFRFGPLAYGFQCHVEATPGILKGWMDRIHEETGGTGPGLRQRLEAEMTDHFDRAMEDGAAIIDGWLDLVSIPAGPEVNPSTAQQRGKAAIG